MLRNIFSLSEEGSRRIYTGILLHALHNISIILPTILLLFLSSDMIQCYIGKKELNSSLMIYWGAAFLLLVIIYWIYRFTYRKTYIAGYEESAHTRTELAEKIRKLPLSYFGNKDLSDLTSTLMDDTSTVEHTLCTDVTELFGSMLSSVGILIILFFFDWKMSLSLVICLPVSMLVIILSRWLSSSSNWNNRNAKLGASEGIQEYLENAKVLHASPNKDMYRKTVEKKIKKVVGTSIIYELVMGIFVNISYNVLRIGLGLVVVTGSYLITHGEIDLITYLLFLFIAARIYDPFTTIFFKMGEFFYSFVGASRIKEIKEYPIQKGNKDITLHSYDITFKNVTFAYNKETVIDHVSFVAKQGEITALVGPSGCGKSTLSKLACRFWDVHEGEITIDGHNVNDMDPEMLLGYFSIVFQDVILFNDTLYNNIKIGKKDATKEEIIAAAKMAQCHDFIELLPEGYDTIIGENGKTLSGGERQRISIARAFLKDAPIILLDEATASLDPENETLIQEAIGRLIDNKTVLIIAHRLRSVEDCHKIVVLKEGKIKEMGKHGELMALNGLYRRLFELQRKSSSWGVGNTV